MPNETFSREDLSEILGDDDHAAAAELHALFAVEAQRILSEIEAAVARSDGAAVARAAHKLKSVAGNVGGRATRDLALAIEAAARLGDRERMAHLAPALGLEVHALGTAFGAYVAALEARSDRH